ncbi:hypothetical protein SGFS_013250 [Streptomyces graminofaciens]|uniref:Uncharacterized protein n=1 Tax=Streptomyces graminofaciens TaxID=68212 RepID=A0ABN5VA78_9ACTN|nr:hypothetical protein [Streptomyces graminofaciens]BBC30031.1 hypothetical protein SGFS_013250 [Streptomyces graminofaciens]
MATPQLTGASMRTDHPALAPGFSLVPMLIGRPDNAQYVWGPCPTTWCHIKHDRDRQVAIEDVWHSGDYIDLELPHRDGTELLAYFRLGLDPYSADESKRRPFIFAEDGNTAMGYYMDPEHVEAMCDKAEKSIARLRAMAAACREAATEVAA